MFQNLGFFCTPEQLVEYKKMWNGPYHGFVPLDIMTKVMASLDDNAELMKILVSGADVDGNGFIEEKEFNSLVKCLLAHNPQFAIVAYDNFLAEADTNKDGKISITEAVDWFSEQGKKGKIGMEGI
ncbi:Parvalbumin-7 [Folsomia candida]|uniref:Parvalbumin-7 n=1 Tax=Folsomia candida TaxID=158441 RepID=A0A226DDQ2_FOLCA|nr:Parvalbumin-7 [Folsomia candida]